jgi:hypothetical protein
MIMKGVSMEIAYQTKLSKQEELYEFYGCLGWNDFLSLNAKQLLKAM